MSWSGTVSWTVPPFGAPRIVICFRPGVPLEDLARAVEPEMIRYHEPCNDRLAQAPARLDHPLVVAGDRILREHDSGGVGIEQPLDDDADARAGEEADALTVGDRGIGIRRPPDFLQRGDELVRRGHVEQRQVLPGEARLGAVLVGSGRAHRQRPAERPRLLVDRADRALLAGGDGFHDGAGKRDARRDWNAFAKRLPEADRLRAEQLPADRLLPPQAAGMSCYSAAEEIMPFEPMAIVGAVRSRAILACR